jgi:hypothetical protein
MAVVFSTPRSSPNRPNMVSLNSPPMCLSGSSSVAAHAKTFSHDQSHQRRFGDVRPAKRTHARYRGRSQTGHKPPLRASLDQLVGALLEVHRHVEAERLRGLEIDHQLELNGSLDGQLAGLGALHDAIGIGGHAPKTID